jgi:hypothetical protein
MVEDVPELLVAPYYSGPYDADVVEIGKIT